MKQLFIEPSDVWLFRDGRPFAAGTDRRAASVFPPFPSVTAGVLRTAYLLAKGIDPTDFKNGKSVDAKQAIGSPNDVDYGRLHIRGPFLAEADAEGNVIRYYPTPADLYVRKSLRTNDYTCHLPKLLPTAGAAANWPLDTLAAQTLWLDQRNSDEYKVENAKGWLTAGEMKNYLSNNVANIKIVENEELFANEERLGIELGNGKTTVEGMLYTVGFTRTHWTHERRVGLSLEVDGADWLADSGTLSMGGERRVGHYYEATIAAPITYATGPRLRVYFATPACFEDGWQPVWSNYFDGDPQLVAAAVNQPLTMAGYDLANNQHKQARRFVPAGSVYYLKSSANIQLKQDENGIPVGVSDFGAQIGFGQVLIGGW